tara:strand:- start:77 stop:439 length:363 start_codon:yes stop_codon:yes gene_type:complete
MSKQTLVIGASLNESRYSNIAIHKLKANNYHVEAIGLKKGIVSNVVVNTEKKVFENIDTITMYLSPINQKQFYNYIVDLNPSRVIFNPGTVNEEFINFLKKNKISTEIACTLVLLSTNQY